MASDPKIPLKIEVSKEYAAVLEKISGLRARQQAAKTESAEIRIRLQAGQGNDGRDARAAALISGGTVEDSANDKARLGVLARDIADIERAIELLSENVSVESNRASQLVCDVAEEPYKAAVADICEILAALHVSHLKLSAITQSLNDDRVAWTGRMWPMQPHRFLGEPKDPFSPVGCYLREAEQHGFISTSQIPSDLRV